MEALIALVVVEVVTHLPLDPIVVPVEDTEQIVVSSTLVESVVTDLADR